MKKWFKTLAATCAFIPFAQCALVPGGNFASAAEPAAATSAPAPATTDADPALWVVKDEDTTIYLFGTVHVLKPGLGWFDEAVKTAFDKSDQLMLEMTIPEDPATVKAATDALAIDPEGRSLSSRLNERDRLTYAAAIARLGLSADYFEPYEPWYSGVVLSVMPLLKLGYNPAFGPEMTLSNAAKKSDKPIIGFETMEEQFGYFDALPEDAQIAFLNSVIKDIDKVGPTIDALVVEWSKGDAVALAKIMNESMTETPALARTLLWDRNSRWADKIKARMAQPGTVFVAVGAGHLAGDNSLQDYLAERGLTAWRIKY